MRSFYISVMLLCQALCIVVVYMNEEVINNMGNFLVEILKLQSPGMNVWCSPCASSDLPRRRAAPQMTGYEIVAKYLEVVMKIGSVRGTGRPEEWYVNLYLYFLKNIENLIYNK